jgi:hypothetical protein
LCEFKDMNMEAEEAMALKPLFGENQWSHSRLRRLSTYCSKLCVN